MKTDPFRKTQRDAKQRRLFFYKHRWLYEKTQPTPALAKKGQRQRREIKFQTICLRHCKKGLHI